MKRADEERRTDPKAAISSEGAAQRERFSMTPGRWTLIAVAAIGIIALISYSFLRRTVGSAQPETPPAPSPAGTVQFRMEQQWLIKMKLAQAEKQEVARQITSTGRVVPAARNQDVEVLIR